MNYRHIYHAGNFADVFKHVLLSLLLERLRAKDAPFCVLDTHAGIGLYDLTSTEARKTAEADAGILRLMQAPNLPEALHPYLDAVRSVNEAGSSIRLYPGSPALARHFLRPQDRLVLAELHPADAQTLKGVFSGDRQVAVHHTDGYTALKAQLPPAEKRGLVLVDPPFEAADEFTALTTGLETGYRRWPTGIYALWYPIKERPTIWRFEEALIATGIRRILKAEFMIHPEDTHLRLNGCGMMIINPPWQLDTVLQGVLPTLHSALEPAGGGTTVEWLVPE